MTPLRELYDLYYYPNPAKEERRRQLLAEIPTDARDEENYGRTSLHIAAEFADCEAIASLLDRGAEVNDRDEEGHTPLFRLASRRSRISALEDRIATAARLLLDRGANLPRSARGTTALIEAVQNRHHAMAAVLIDSGQRLDSANSYGDNALHILCRRAADTAREIAGKERFIASFGERWVSEKQQREAREELEELQAEQMRCYATAALLLHSGQIDPDEKNSAGRRAFDLAMEGGAKWVSALLSGEDPFDELTMETGGMDLFQALRKKDRKALEALLRAGADPDTECDDREMNDWTGKTPLVCALEWGETEIAAMLLGPEPIPISGPRKVCLRLPSGSSGVAAFRTAWSVMRRYLISSNSGDGTPTPRKRGKTNGPLCWHASTMTTNWLSGPCDTCFNERSR